MSLETIVQKATDKLKLNFLPASRDRMRDYVMKYELKDYFSKDVPEEYRDKFMKGLERISDTTMEKYSTELHGSWRKATGKGLMGTALLNDVYAYVSSVPFLNVTTLGLGLFAAKSVAEAPALKRYLTKSHDWYGAISHVLMKPVNYLIPVVGAAIESGSFERMVKGGVRKEIVREFVKQYGKYENIEDRLSEKVKEPLRDNIVFMPAGKKELRRAA